MSNKQTKTSAGEMGRDFVERYYIHFILVLITLAALAMMLFYAGSRELWIDEIITVNYTRVEYGENLFEFFSNFQFEMVNPPLFYFVASIWIRIVPNDPFWLRLISVIFTTIGIYICGIIAKTLKGNRAAVLTVIFAATSWFLFVFPAWQFRAFGLLFLLSALTTYLYILRTQSPQEKKYWLIYGVSALLTMYTHHFGLLLVALMGLFDLGLILRKKLNWRLLLVYFGCVLLYAPYFMYVVYWLDRRGGAHFWPRVPDLQFIFYNLYSLFSDFAFVAFSFFVGVAVILIAAVMKYTHFGRSCIEKQNGTKSCIISAIAGEKVYFCVVSAAVVFITIVGAIIYSRYINPEGSLFVRRYFTSILPHLLIIAAIGADWMLGVILVNVQNRTERIIISVVLIAALGIMLGISHILTLNLFALGEIFPQLGPVRGR